MGTKKLLDAVGKPPSGPLDPIYMDFDSVFACGLAHGLRYVDEFSSTNFPLRQEIKRLLALAAAKDTEKDEFEEEVFRDNTKKMFGALLDMLIDKAFDERDW